MRVEQVDFISIPTRNVARAVAWYSKVLGLPESDVSEGELETPNVTDHLTEASGRSVGQSLSV